MKRLFLFAVIFCGLASPSFGQLTIEACYEKARANYPLVVQYGLIEQAEQYNLANAAKGYLPQATLSGRVTYQSEVTEIPIEIPGVEIPTLNKDQYNIALEVSQAIWDGGMIRAQKKIASASAQADAQKLGVDLYALNDRVNQLFFGILLIEEQLIQNDVLDRQWQENYDQVAAYIAGGIANRADLDAIRVNQLSTRQRRTELSASLNAYRTMLGALIGEPIPAGSGLVKPTALPLRADYVNQRPELDWISAQTDLLENRKQMVNAQNRPQFGAFIQGAYGNPGLNMLKNDFSPYYIAGVRLSWKFGGLYTKKNDLRLIDNSQKSLAAQRETFLFNTGLQIDQQTEEIEKLEKLQQDDAEIIRLRENIRRAAEAKVANGTMSVVELTREVLSEDLARQNRVLHEIQWLQAIYNLKYTTNN